MEYQNTYTDEHGNQVTITMKTRYSDPREMTGALRFMTKSARRFYLDAKRRFNKQRGGISYERYDPSFQ